MMEKMQNTMMKNYKMFGWLGLIVVIVAFLFSLSGAGANAAFFSEAKAIREGTDTALIAANVTRNAIPHWVPSFKFVGLGLLLGAITMSLGVIATTLRDLGGGMMSHWPAKLNLGTPEKPRSAKMFPMIMMMGWMVLIVGFIVALVTLPTVQSYWNNSIAEVLNQAQTGSELLDQLGLIKGVQPWLNVLRFTGMALLFTAITVALTVIIRTLQAQEKTLRNFVNVRTGSN
jgi:hypothetical protein